MAMTDNDILSRVGIFDHQCPHRCASFFYGRNEENGLRCVYHGWKFDVDGNCLDQPNIPEQNKFLDGVKAIAYKTTERAGLVYVYMGERAVPPPLPDIEPTMCEPEDAITVLTQRDSNWLQHLEGDVDTSHVAFLHFGGVDVSRLDPNELSLPTMVEKAPQFNATETDFGAMYSASRPAGNGKDHHRFGCFVFPFWVTYPSGPLETACSANAWVPIDDEHTMVFNIGVKSQTGVGRAMRYKDGEIVPGLARPIEYLPNTTDWMGRFRSARNETNDYGIDREAQRTTSFSGIIGVPMQDHAIIDSLGPIVNRELEHLASSDRMIVVTRRRLLEAALEYQETGKLPEIVDNPSLCRDIRGGDILVPAGTDWLEGYWDAMKRAQGPTHPLANAAE